MAESTTSSTTTSRTSRSAPASQSYNVGLISHQLGMAVNVSVDAASPEEALAAARLQVPAEFGDTPVEAVIVEDEETPAEPSA